MVMTKEQKAARLKLLKRRNRSRKVSAAQTRRWAEKREHERAVAHQAGTEPWEFDPDHAGSPDKDLLEVLPETLED